MGVTPEAPMFLKKGEIFGHATCLNSAEKICLVARARFTSINSQRLPGAEEAEGGSPFKSIALQI
jgi:hypothetical protein